ncbi:MAG: hypothetical protein HQ480_00485 [Candidatus Pelagibacter sp.]|nr:hypothetical protein [Candidatus Pelagibacter sp.]
MINKPMVIISNNDDCVISRSNETKNLNIRNGCDCFQV